MNEREIWMFTYMANIEAGRTHPEAMAFADEVIQRTAVLND